uniref:Chitin-binding type-2 domain-containing protein n=2 Tax=Anopheles albimanus TaxID=7167 RepID=A0A182FM65_ANOAL
MLLRVLRQSPVLLLLLLLHTVLVLVGGHQVDNAGDAAAAAAAAPEVAWECPRPGRFPNPADPSCRTYLTCALEPVAANGSRTLAPARQDECWPGALFSGRYQRCITGDDCGRLEDFYAIEYECRECGKYVLESSTDCRHFVNCLKTRDPGVFVPIRQRCPDERPLFSPPAHACVPEEEYECGGGPAPPLPSLLAAPPPPTTTQPPQVTTTTTTTTTVAPPTGHYLSDLVCLGVGRFPDESVPHCRGYRLCTQPASAGNAGSAGTALVSRSFLCDPGTVFSEYERRCVPAGSYQCPDDGTPGIGTGATFRCVAIGRFPDRESPGCERFYRCRRASDGTLDPVPVLERCPPGTSFSWLTTRCVPSAEYVCPVGVQEQEPDTSSLTSRCVRSGRFANEADATCRTYYICTRDQRGAWAMVLIRCPAGTVFSRARARCVGSEASVAGTAATEEEEEQEETESGSGRASVADCRADHTSDGGSGDTGPIPDGAPWLTWSATEPLTADASAQLVDGGDLLLPASTAVRPYSPPEYPCTATGRFADINSVDCRSYFLCKLHHPTNPLPQPAAGGGSSQHQHQHQHQQQQQILVSVHMTCPDGMLFSRNTNKCVISNRHVC